MAQSNPGPQNERFFELLHPNTDRAGLPPPPPLPPPSPLAAATSISSFSPSVDSAADGSSALHHSPIRTMSSSYDLQLAPNSGEVPVNLEDSTPLFPQRPVFAVSTGEQHQGSVVDTTKCLVHGRPVDPKTTVDCVTMDAINHTMKQYTTNILQVLDCVNGRLAQLETRVQGLDATFAELKAAEQGKQDQNHGTLMKLESLMEEVHRAVQNLHGHQRLDEAKSQLSKLNLDETQIAGKIVPQTTGGGQQPETAKENHPHGGFPESSNPLPGYLPPQYPSSAQQQHSHAPPPIPMQGFATFQIPLPSPFISSPTHQQPFPPTVHHTPSQQQQSSQQAPQPTPQVFLQVPSFHSQSATQPSPPNSYNLPVDSAAYSQMQTVTHPALHVPPTSSYLSESSHYVAGMYGGPQQLPVLPDVLHSPQQHNLAGPQHTHDSAGGRLGISIPHSYGQPPLPKQGLPGPSMHEAPGSGGYGVASYHSAHSVPSSPGGGGTGYPKLPTAQPLQHGLPAANPVSRLSIRSPVDDVIDRVNSMGFSREQTLEVVRHLTENGQAVDTNIVLDKLMNGRGSSQNVRGWFNRG